MPKRRSDERDRMAKPPRQHLYLVLDDWALGYSIRKIDLSAHSHSNYPGQFATSLAWGDSIGAQLLPPAIFRVEAPRGLPMYFAGAFGTKIMAMHPRESSVGPHTHPIMPKRLVTAFDVHTRTMVFYPRPNQDVSYPFYIPIGNKLFALSESFQMLNPPQPNDPTGQWRKLPEPPFNSRFVTSYAVHPDGRTIFVSIGDIVAPATFSFHMVEDMERSSRWESLGEWTLPFDGGAHFDAKLNAWVGLSTYPDDTGHLCVCDVIPARDGQLPSWKISKETFFSEDPAERHVGATLVYMGQKSKFCLVECIWVEDKHVAGRIYNYREDVPLPCRYLFRVSTFALKYDKNGDLTAGSSRRVQYYSAPPEATMLLLRLPVAFWM